MLCKPKPTRSARRAECRLPADKKTNRYDTKSCNSGLPLPTAHGAAVHLRVRTSLLSAQARRAAGALPSLSLSTVYVDIRFHRILRLSPAGLSEHGTKVVNFARTAKFNFENYQQLLNSRTRRATPRAARTHDPLPLSSPHSLPPRTACRPKTVLVSLLLQKITFFRFRRSKISVIEITALKIRIFG